MQQYTYGSVEELLAKCKNLRRCNNTDILDTSASNLRLRAALIMCGVKNNRT